MSDFAGVPNSAATWVLTVPIKSMRFHSFGAADRHAFGSEYAMLLSAPIDHGEPPTPKGQPIWSVADADRSPPDDTREGSRSMSVNAVCAHAIRVSPDALDGTMGTCRRGVPTDDKLIRSRVREVPRWAECSLDQRVDALAADSTKEGHELGEKLMTLGQTYGFALQGKRGLNRATDQLETECAKKVG